MNDDIDALFVVALLAEGVDRNKTQEPAKNPDIKSPSSRRAWIEISSLVSVTA